jgi:hypothetical protein
MQAWWSQNGLPELAPVISRMEIMTVCQRQQHKGGGNCQFSLARFLLWVGGGPWAGDDSLRLLGYNLDAESPGKGGEPE